MDEKLALEVERDEKLLCQLLKMKGLRQRKRELHENLVKKQLEKFNEGFKLKELKKHFNQK